MHHLFSAVLMPRATLICTTGVPGVLRHLLCSL